MRRERLWSEDEGEGPVDIDDGIVKVGHDGSTLRVFHLNTVEVVVIFWSECAGCSDEGMKHGRSEILAICHRWRQQRDRTENATFDGGRTLGHALGWLDHQAGFSPARRTRMWHGLKLMAVHHCSRGRC